MTMEAIKILNLTAANHPHMVPKLKKLIEALKSSNLSSREFIEIAKQVKFLFKIVKSLKFL